MGDVIEFPTKKPEEGIEFDANIEMTHILVMEFINTIGMYGYDLNSESIKHDVAILINIYYAMLERHDGKLHFLDRILDDLGEFYNEDL